MKNTLQYIITGLHSSARSRVLIVMFSVVFGVQTKLPRASNVQQLTPSEIPAYLRPAFRFFVFFF